MNNDNLILVEKKPVKCQKCGFKPVATILYGEPAMDYNLAMKIDSKKIVIGGCCQMIDAPQWTCTNCGAKYRKKAMDDF